MLFVAFTVGSISLKILSVWLLAKVSATSNNKKHNTRKQSCIKVEVRSCEIEECYLIIKNKFKSLLQNGQLSRKEMLAIRDYLYSNVQKYERKKFKNDAHAIYTMLKATDLTVTNLYELEKFLTSIESNIKANKETLGGIINEKINEKTIINN